MHQYPQTDKAWVERNSDNRYENMGRRFSRIGTGAAWAQVSMTPYRLFKGFPAEGGIRSPLIISGPGVAKPGTRSDAFAHVMDVAATILSAANVTHPGELKDLSHQRPKLRDEMIGIWNQYSRETGVVLPSGGVLSF